MIYKFLLIIQKNIFNLHIIKKFFTKKFFYTINHKKLGLFYFYFSFITAITGSYLATCIRLEMAYPGSPFFDGDSLKYLQTISAHAIIMIFFVVVPIFFGGFANFLLPYHIGSKDVAFPRLNNLGFWIQPCGFILIAKIGSLRLDYWTSEIKTSVYSAINKNSNYLANVQNEEIVQITTYIDTLKSLLSLNSDLSYKVLYWKTLINSSESFWFIVKNNTKFKRRKRFIVKCSNAPQTVSGWTFITPFSSNVEYTAIGIQDMLILGVYFVGISTTISLINLLITRRTLSISGLRNRRILIPFISITILLMLRTLSVITPILGSAMLMLLTDRHWKTSFFDFSYGGDPIFFQHLFWFFGHPEVYVLIIPAFGIINSILPNINYRRVASKHHLIWAIYIMNYMGFLVWGHHMYLIGLDHRSRALYSTITIMISLPATIKVVNWTFTLVNGVLNNNLILYATLSFILFFLVAGFTGMWLSHVSLNISMHDTLYVVAHFHLMLSGAVVMGIFVGFYYYYHIFLEIKYSKVLSYVHIIYYTAGQWLTFIPLFWLAFSGLPRRVHDFPMIYIGWQSLATVGHLTTMIGVFAFYLSIIESTIEKKTDIYIINIISRFLKINLFFYNKITVINKILTKQQSLSNKKEKFLFTNKLTSITIKFSPF